MDFPEWLRLPEQIAVYILNGVVFLAFLPITGIRRMLSALDWFRKLDPLKEIAIATVLAAPLLLVGLGGAAVYYASLPIVGALLLMGYVSKNDRFDKSATQLSNWGEKQRMRAISFVRRAWPF